MTALQRSETPPSWNEIVDWSAVSKSLWRQWHHAVYRCAKALYIVVSRALMPNIIICWQIVLPGSERNIYHAADSCRCWRKTSRSTPHHACDPGSRILAERRASIAVTCCEQCAKYRCSQPPRQTPLKPFQAGDLLETNCDSRNPMLHRRGRHRKRNIRRPARYNDFK
jgi:hypothetical protein